MRSTKKRFSLNWNQPNIYFANDKSENSRTLIFVSTESHALEKPSNAIKAIHLHFNQIISNLIHGRKLGPLVSIK